MDRGAPQDLLDRLADALGMPVVVCAATWRCDMAVDLDEVAARHLIDQFEELAASGSSDVALVLIGRGGFVGFADLVRRAARHISIHCTVPYLVSGRVALAALAGTTLKMGRYAAVGAVDSPCAHHSLRHDRAAALGLGRRILGADIEHLSLAHLGDGQGLHAGELSGLGVDAHDIDAEADRALWDLFEAYEASLGLREAVARRYEESDVGDEVEWEFATGLAGAFIETSSNSLVLLLDTGSPDPDTGRLDGDWTSDGDDEILELDFENAKPA